MLPFYLKYLGPEPYGLVGFFTMTISWMALLDMGLGSTILRETARLKNKLDGLKKIKKLIRSVEFFFIIVSIGLIVVIISSNNVIANDWFNVDKTSISTVQKSINIMMIMLIFRLFVGLYQGAIIGFEFQVWLNIFRIIISTFKFIGAFFLVKYISNDILDFFIYQLCLAIIEFLVMKHKVYNVIPKTDFIYPSIETIKEVLPFSLSLAYTTITWIIFSQADKLLLSHYLPLSEFGYFALVVAISGGIVQISLPLVQAIQPRMAALIEDGKILMALNIYHKGTKFLSAIVISVATIIVLFSYNILHIWTDDIEASIWAEPVLIWYVIGNAFVAIWSIQFNLQYAYGNLKYDVRFHTFFIPLSLPIIYFAVVNYGAIGAGITWLAIQIIIFLVWAPFIHLKFAPKIHKIWIFEDIFPSLILSSMFAYVVSSIEINFSQYSRVESLLIILSFGFILLLGNIFIYKEFRTRILNCNPPKN